MRISLADAVKLRDDLLRAYLEGRLQAKLFMPITHLIRRKDAPLHPESTFLLPQNLWELITKHAPQVADSLVTVETNTLIIP